MNAEILLSIKEMCNQRRKNVFFFLHAEPKHWAQCVYNGNVNVIVNVCGVLMSYQFCADCQHSAFIVMHRFSSHLIVSHRIQWKVRQTFEMIQRHGKRSIFIFENKITKRPTAPAILQIENFLMSIDLNEQNNQRIKHTKW